MLDANTELKKAAKWFQAYRLSLNVISYHISNEIASSIFALSQIKNILPLNISLLVYNSLVRPHIEYGIVT